MCGVSQIQAWFFFCFVNLFVTSGFLGNWVHIKCDVCMPNNLYSAIKLHKCIELSIMKQINQNVSAKIYKTMTDPIILYGTSGSNRANWFIFMGIKLPVFNTHNSDRNFFVTVDDRILT